MKNLKIEDYKENIINIPVSPFYIQNGKVYAVGTQNDIDDINYIDIVVVNDVTPIANWNNKNTFCEINTIGIARYNVYCCETEAYKDYCKGMLNNDIIRKDLIKPQSFVGSSFDNSSKSLDRVLSFDVDVKSILSGESYTINVTTYSSTHRYFGKLDRKEFYALNNCEYNNTEKDDNSNLEEIGKYVLNKSLKKKLEVIYDEYIKKIIDDFKFTWAIKRKNNNKEYTGKTIKIGDTVYANGFLFESPYHRRFLGATLIPKGYRIAKISEIEKIFSHKFLSKVNHNPDINTYRNALGFEYSVDNHSNKPISFYTYENTNIYDEQTYFPIFLKNYYISKSYDNISFYANNNIADLEYFNNWGSYYLLVKMTDEEIKKENDTINDILNQNEYRKLTIDKLLKNLGILDIDKIKSIEFKTTNNGVNIPKDKCTSETITKNAASNSINEMIRYLSNVFGEENINVADKIHISVSNKNGLNIQRLIDRNSEIDIKSYLKMILPLLCREAVCYDNVNIPVGYSRKNFFNQLICPIKTSGLIKEYCNIIAAARYAVKAINRPIYDYYNRVGSEKIEYVKIYYKDDYMSKCDVAVIKFGDIKFHQLLVSDMYDNFRDSEEYNEIYKGFKELYDEKCY